MGTVFCWRESPWTCVQDFCTELCLRGITRRGRTLFSHVICLVCLVSALQFSYEFHREREREGKKEKDGFSCGAQQQQRHWMSWPMKGQLLDGFPRCVLGGTAYWWHLQTTNKAVRLKTPISAQWTVKMWDSIIFSNKALTYYTRVFQSAEKEHSSYETNQSALSNSTPKPNHFKLSNSPHLQQPPISPPPKRRF